jgi:uncharacterized protein
MRRFLKSIFLFVLLFFIPCLSLSAAEFPEKPDRYVTDSARLLSNQTEEKLERILHDYEIQTTNQVVVVTFPSLEGESLEDFSIRLAEKWQVGQKGKDNGVILLIFKKERQMRIEVGYGLEGALPDALAGQIIQQVMAPYFKQGKYDEGVLAGVNAILQATQGEFKAERGSQGVTSSEIEVFFKILFLIAAFLFLVDLFRYSFYFAGHRFYPDRYSFWEWWFLFGLLLFVLNLIFRALFDAALYSRGGYYGSRSGFGGFSGGSSGGLGGFSGGGGSFGGGGASGRW